MFPPRRVHGVGAEKVDAAPYKPAQHHLGPDADWWRRDASTESASGVTTSFPNISPPPGLRLASSHAQPERITNGVSNSSGKRQPVNKYGARRSRGKTNEHCSLLRRVLLE